VQSLLKAIFRGQELRREFGPIAAIGLALKKLLLPVVRVGSVYLMECDLASDIPKVRPVPGIIAREGFLQDVHLLDGLGDGATKTLDAIERLSRGQRWFIGIDASRGKLANSRWVATAWELVPELERNVILKPGQAFVYDLFTPPEYRRRGIDSFTRQYTYDHLFRFAGIRTVLAHIRAENTVSIKAGRKFLKKIGRVWYFCILGRRTRVFWLPNPKMPTLAPGAPSPVAQDKLEYTRKPDSEHSGESQSSTVTTSRLSRAVRR
jgi:GNAT superfamily N-acetyltransferase